MTDKTQTNINDVLASDIPETYINGFQIAAGQADIILILQRNGKNVETINLSFTIAKTLAQGLSEVVQKFETETGMNIKTTKDIAEHLGKK